MLTTRTRERYHACYVYSVRTPMIAADLVRRRVQSRARRSDATGNRFRLPLPLPLPHRYRYRLRFGLGLGLGEPRRLFSTSITSSPSPHDHDPRQGRSPDGRRHEHQGATSPSPSMTAPTPETTPAVIAALEKYDIPTTFFIVTQRLLGKHGEKSRDVLRRRARRRLQRRQPLGHASQPRQGVRPRHSTKRSTAARSRRSRSTPTARSACSARPTAR